MKKKLLIILIILIALCVGAFGCWKYLDSTVYSSNTFADKTYINGVNCSNMTIVQAKKALSNAWNRKTFTFRKDGKVIETVNGFDLEYDIDEQLKTLKRNDLLGAAVNYHFGTKFEASVSMTAKEPTEKLIKELRNSPAFEKKVTRKTRNAYVNLKSETFEIVQEVYGDNIDFTALAQGVLDLIEDGTFEMEYVDAVYFEKPTITTQSEELKERQAYCNQYLISNVTHTFGDEKVTIPPVTMDKIISVKDGKVSASKKQVKEYVKQLASDYTTIGTERNFKSYSGNRISVSGGIYGYSINVDQETEQLIKDLESREKISREPIWAQKGWGTYDNDIGSTYVEISLTRQHLWYFKNGKEVVSCPVVTGNLAEGYGTPTGVFQLTYRQWGATLKGSNSDGSSYESPVSYWMPFYGNYGMHDAPWRGEFGGNIYKTNGSHGCVNMPIPSAATLINNLADSGTPVIVYW